MLCYRILSRLYCYTFILIIHARIFLILELYTFIVGDLDLLSGGRALFPEKMPVVLIVSVLLCVFSYYLVHAFIH